ncbi:translocation/assembly module TamB domain-containing protein [Frigidibacter sp. MR17.24]|uniref:translocation/assembly module TamB domain-containing protein n=1 Tax=Frigidibacter sp. MR17.24 TaxID=3127345 RepID=UPI003012A6F8
MTRRTLLPLAALCLLPLGAAAQDQATQDQSPQDQSAQAAPSGDEDRGWLTGLIEDSLGGEGRTVRLEGFEGALSSRATFDSLTISDDQGPWLTIRGGAMQWSRLALLRRQIDIRELSAESIELDRLPASEPDPMEASTASSGFSLPELPVSLNLESLIVGEVSLGQPIIGTPVDFSLTGSANLAGGEGNVDIQAERTDGQQGRISLTGGFVNETEQATVALDLSEGASGILATTIGLPGAPALELAVNGQGPLSDFTADIRLATDNQPRLTGTVELTATEAAEGQEPTRGFRVDLGGDVAPLFLPAYQDFFGNDVRLQAQGSRGPDGAMDLPSLTLSAQALQLTGRAQVGADGVPTLADLALTLGLPGGGDVLLPTSGSETYVTSAALNLDYDAATGPDWRLAGNLKGLRSATIGIEDLTLDGSGQLAQGATADLGGTVDFAASGVTSPDPDLARALGPSLTGSADLATVDEGFAISNLSLQGEGYGMGGDLTISGPSGDLAVAGTVSANVADLDRYSGLAGQSLSGATEARVEGRYAVLTGAFDARVNLDGTDLGAGIDPVDALLSGRSTLALDAGRSTEGTVIRSARLQAQTLTATAVGTVAPGRSDLTADLDFTDLSVMGGPYGGALNASAHMREAGPLRRFDIDGTGRDLRVGVPQLDGLLRGETTLSLIGGLLDNAVTLDVARINGQAVSLDATGRYGPGDADLKASFRLPDLSVMGAGYGGALTADATLVESGGADAPVRDFSLTGRGQDLAVGIQQASGLLQGATELDLRGRQDGTALRLDVARLAGPRVTLDAAGTYDPGASDLRAEIGLPDLSVMGPGYRGRLNANATLTETGTAAAPVRRITLNGDANDLAVNQPEADRILAGATTIALVAEEDQGAVRIEQLDLQNPQLTASASGATGGDGSQITLQARLANMALVVPQFPGPLSVSGTIAQPQGQGYRLDLTAEGPGGVNARAQGSVAADFATADLSVTGSAQAALANPFIAPQTVDGPISFDLRLNGAPGLDALSGRVSTRGTRVSVPAASLALEGIDATVDLSGGRAQIAVKARGSEGGTINVSGPVTLSGSYPADLAIRLGSLVLKDPQLYQTSIAGDLAIDGPLMGGAEISGRLALGETEIRVPSTGFAASGAVTGLRHVNDSAAVRRTRARAGADEVTSVSTEGTSGGFPLDVRISAPNQIFVRGRGLDAELGGELRVRGTTNDVQPQGQFELVRGRLDILGQRFTLDEGLIQLQGTLVPVITFAASTTTDTDTATIRIEGPASDPQISFVSANGLPQEEVLSQLLFGRGLDNISPLQAAQLASAVSTLAGRGGDGIIGNLRKSTGLDDLDVTTDSDGAAAVRAGRYISDKVYTDVTVGAGGSTSINLNLDVTRNITARGSAEGDGGTSIGIYFEKDY